MWTQLMSINYLAVILAAVVYYALWALWYSDFLFWKIWKMIVPMNKDDMKDAGKAMTIMWILSLLSAFFLAILIPYDASLWFSLFLWLVIWIVAGLVDYQWVNFEKRNSTTYWIGAFYNVAGFILMALVIWLFR